MPSVDAVAGALKCATVMQQVTALATACTKKLMQLEMTNVAEYNKAVAMPGDTPSLATVLPPDAEELFAETLMSIAMSEAKKSFSGLGAFRPAHTTMVMIFEEAATIVAKAAMGDAGGAAVPAKPAPGKVSGKATRPRRKAKFAGAGRDEPAKKRPRRKSGGRARR